MKLSKAFTNMAINSWYLNFVMPYNINMTSLFDVVTEVKVILKLLIYDMILVQFCVIRGRWHSENQRRALALFCER